MNKNELTEHAQPAGRAQWSERIKRAGKIGFFAFLAKGLLWLLVPLLWMMFESFFE